MNSCWRGVWWLWLQTNSSLNFDVILYSIEKPRALQVEKRMLRIEILFEYLRLIFTVSFYRALLQQQGFCSPCSVNNYRIDRSLKDIYATILNHRYHLQQALATISMSVYQHRFWYLITNFAFHLITSTYLRSRWIFFTILPWYKSRSEFAIIVK